ncbi:hypothetical protein QQM79_10545 [Marinobacteraceae bacterium S3BR75-40.1]
MQDRLKQSLEQITNVKGELQEALNQQFTRASGELKAILKELGVDLNQVKSLGDVVTQLRAKNPTLKNLMLNLDAATYDTRKRLSWNAYMTSAYARTRAEEAYEQNLRPRITEYADTAETQVRELIEKATALTKRDNADAGKSADA